MMERQPTDEDEATEMIGRAVQDQLPPGAKFVLLALMPPECRNESGLPVVCISNIHADEPIRRFLREWLSRQD
jgi:hypothetical protein